MERPQFFKDLDRSLAGESEPEPERPTFEVWAEGVTRIYLQDAAYQAQLASMAQYQALARQHQPTPEEQMLRAQQMRNSDVSLTTSLVPLQMAHFPPGWDRR